MFKHFIDIVWPAPPSVILVILSKDNKDSFACIDSSLFSTRSIYKDTVQTDWASAKQLMQLTSPQTASPPHSVSTTFLIFQHKSLHTLNASSCSSFSNTILPHPGDTEICMSYVTRKSINISQPPNSCVRFFGVWITACVAPFTARTILFVRKETAEWLFIVSSKYF